MVSAGDEGDNLRMVLNAPLPDTLPSTPTLTPASQIAYSLNKASAFSSCVSSLLFVVAGSKRCGNKYYRLILSQYQS